mmetsp:Transcript_4013/g.9832  ORF Transcript_4013/g.9832 Transcript_4013/m.9832 type:complete len:88 (-) Transcript_4013:674-937(-)
MRKERRRIEAQASQLRRSRTNGSMTHSRGQRLHDLGLAKTTSASVTPFKAKYSSCPFDKMGFVRQPLIPPSRAANQLNLLAFTPMSR